MSLNFFFGEVVKVAGKPEENDLAGDVQIRVEVDQDDKSRLKDEDLRWARNVWPVTAAQHRGVGVGGGFLIPGTRVFGFYADNDRQIPYILGTVATAGAYGSLKVGDELRSRGLVGTGDKKETGLFGLPALATPVEDAAKKLVEAPIMEASKAKPKPKPKEKSPQAQAENAPQAKLPSLTGIPSPAAVADMVGVVKSFNPGNLGGMMSTLGAFQNIRGKIDGEVQQLIGNLPFGQLQVLSGVININPSNILGSISGIVNGISGIAGALGGNLGQLQGMLSGAQGMFASIPMGPLQNMAVNIAVGAAKSAAGGPNALGDIGYALNELAAGASFSLNEVSGVAASLSRFVNAGQSGNVVGQLMAVSAISQQIDRLAQNIDLAAPVSAIADGLASGAISEIQGLAGQLGSVLGVGNQLVSLASNPMALASKVQGLVGNIMGGAGLGGGGGQQQPPGSKERVPADPAQPEYPYNHVTKTVGGHTTKVDNTPGKEQLFVSHKANTFFRVDPDGSVVVHGTKNYHEQVMGTKTVTVEGFADITVKGSKIVIRGGSLIEVMGKADVKVAGDCSFVVAEDFKVAAKNITFSAVNNINMRATNINMSAINKFFSIANFRESRANDIRHRAMKAYDILSGTYGLTTEKGSVTIDSSDAVLVRASNVIDTKGSQTKIQGGGAKAPPTTFK